MPTALPYIAIIIGAAFSAACVIVVCLAVAIAACDARAETITRQDG